MLAPQVKIEQRILWQPQPGPQTALVTCPVFEVFYGGARGGGKTEGSIGDWLQHQHQYGENAIGIFFRRKLTQLAEVVARTKQIFPKLGAKYNEQQKTWTMANGARLKFAYLERDADAEEYQGHSYTRIYIEEATNFPSSAPIMKLKATLRSGAGVPCGIRLTGNPGGPGHTWVKARYIDIGAFTVVKDREVLEIDGKQIEIELERIFIPSKLKDNKLLIENDPHYILRLRQSGSEQLVRAWLEGDWNIIDGAYFDEFEYTKHVLAREWADLIPKNAPRFRAMDWGSAKPFSVGWYAVSDGTWGLPKLAILKYREWYGAKSPNVGVKMDAGMVAQGIKIREQGEKMHYGVADPAIFIRNGGPSIFEIMAAAGVSWRPADNKRIPGWEQLHYRLKGDVGCVDEVGVPRPMLYFLEDCDDTIRTLPLLQHDESHPEDVDTDGEDHAGDETRYAVMSRPWLPASRPKSAPLAGPRNPWDMPILDLIKRQKRLREQREGA